MHLKLYYLKLIMRTVLFLSFLIVSFTELLFAGYVKAQVLSKKISISIEEKNLPTIFKDLEEHQVYIAYDANKLKLATKTVTAKKFTNNTVDEVLKHVFKGMPIGYKEVGSYITLHPKAIDENGRISGRIIDSRGEPLPNASIRIIELNRTTQSGIDGTYAFQVPAGTYTLEVSYVSYQKQRISTVQVRSGNRTALDIAMKSANAELQEVTVTTTFKKASVAGLYAAQKNAGSVTDGISAEQIARTPDNDMGQVLKRVTGLTTVNNKSVIVRGMSDRYNQAMLDGVVIPSTSQNKRDFSFDIIPTEMVSSVVVNKTATPDVSSEFSGGQVSINTLDIPAENFTSVAVGTGGNSQTTGKDFYRLGKKRNAEYFGFYDKVAKQPEGLTPWRWDGGSIEIPPPGKPGVTDHLVLIPGTDNRPYSSLDAVAQSKKLSADELKLYQYTGSPNANVRLAVGRVYDLKNNMRFGFSASGNIRNEQNIIEFNNVRGTETNANYHFIDSTRYGTNGAGNSYKFNSSSGLVANLGLEGSKAKISLKNMYARTYNNNYNEAVRLNYRDLNQGIRKEVYQLPEAMSLQQHQLSGEYKLPWGIKMDAMLTFNKIKQQILDERKIQYRLTTQIENQYYFQSPNLKSPAINSNNTITTDSRMWTHIDETDYNWAASFSKSFDSVSWLKTLLKLGYQAWHKERSLDVFRMLPYTARGSQIEQPYDVALNPVNIGSDKNQAYYEAEVINGSIYDGFMKSQAMYLMADQKLWDKLRFVYGLRVEYYLLNNSQDKVWRRQYGGDPGEALKYKNLVKDQNWRFLPSINAIYNLTSTFNVRAAYSKTAVRPDFRESAFFGFYDYDLDANISGGLIETTTIDNTDVRLEWYPSPGEIISLTGYYKYLDRPVELTANSGHEGGYYVYTNMAHAKNWGLEFELRKNLSFIAPQDWLSNLFVSANGTLLKSKVKTLLPWNADVDLGNILVQKLGQDQNRPLIGQSPWLLNVGLGYWGDLFGATASYNHRGYRTHLTNQSSNQIEYELAPKQLDLQLYHRFLNKKAELKFNMANLLNDWTRYYFNPEAYKSGPEGTEIKNIGDDRFNKAHGDIIIYRKREGTRYSLSLTYNF